MTEPSRLHRPGRHLAELTLALDRVPARTRDVLSVALRSLAEDLGWHEEVRGTATALVAILEQLDLREPLRNVLQTVESFEDDAIEAGGFAFILGALEKGPGRA
jgi:hypothetical protein